MEQIYVIDPKECLSPHGGLGTVPDTRLEDGVIVCRWCGTRIENPQRIGKDARGHRLFGKGVTSALTKEQRKKGFWRRPIDGAK